MNKKKIITMLLSVAIISQQTGIVALAEGINVNEQKTETTESLEVEEEVNTSNEEGVSEEETAEEYEIDEESNTENTEVVSVVETLYNEIKVILENENYTEELIAKLEASNSLVGVSEYLGKLDMHRKKVFVYRFKEKFSSEKNPTNVESTIKGSTRWAKLLTETSKFKAHFESDKEEVEILYNKNDGVIDITDKVFELENGQVLDSGTVIGKITSKDKAIIVEGNIVKLDTSKITSSVSHIDAIINVDGSTTNTNLKINLVEEVTNNKFEQFYKAVEKYINNPSYTEEGLVELLDANNDILNLSEYISKLDEKRTKILGDTFKKEFIGYNSEDNIIINHELVIKKSIEQAQAYTELNKLKGLNEYRIEFNVVENSGVIDITDLLFEVVEGQTLDSETIIGDFSVGYEEGISIKDGRVLLDTSKYMQGVSWMFNTNFSVKVKNAELKSGFNSRIVIVGSEYKVFYDELKEILATENYTDKLIKKLLANDELVNMIDYLPKLDIHRREVFAYRFKEIFNKINKPIDFKAEIESAVEYAKRYTEASKFKGNNQSQSKLVEIKYNKNDSSINITDEVLELENGQLLDNKTWVRPRDSTHPAIVADRHEVILNGQKVGNDFEAIIIADISMNGVESQMEIRVKMIQKTEEEEFEELYNRLKEVLENEDTDQLIRTLYQYESILNIEQYLMKLDMYRRDIFARSLKEDFDKKNNPTEFKKVVQEGIKYAKLSTEKSKFKGHKDSQSKLVEFIYSKNSGIIDITSKIFEKENKQVLDKDITLSEVVSKEKGILIDGNRVLLDTSKIEGNIDTAIKMKISLDGLSSNTELRVKVNEKEVSEFEVLYNELKVILAQENYKEALIAKLIENDSLLNVSEYISNLDAHRKEVFIYRFKEAFEREFTRINFEETVKGAVRMAKVLTETSKFKGHHQSQNKVVEVSNIKNSGIIDITDAIFALENNQVLDVDTKINGVTSKVDSISVEGDKVLLDTSKVEKDFETIIDMKVSLNGSSSNTGLKVKVVEEVAENKFETLYNEVKAILDKENYKDELIEKLKANNDLLNSTEYLSKLDNTRELVFAKRFKSTFEREIGTVDFEEVFKNSLSFAKTLTESSKLEGHYESSTKIVEVNYDKTKDIVDITDLVTTVESGQELDKATTIEILNANHNGLLVKEGRVLLDTKKLKSTFETYVDMVVELGTMSSKTNVKLKINVPATTEDEIKDQIEKPENGVVEVKPEVTENENNVNISSEIVDSMIDKDLDLEITSEDSNLVVNSEILKELRESLGNKALTITTSDVEDKVIENVNLNGAKPIGNINIDTNAIDKNLGSKMNVKVKVNKNSMKSNDVFVYLIEGKKTTLIQKSKIDNEGYVEFATSKLGNILLTDKKITEEVKPIPPEPPTPPVINEAPVIAAKDITINEGDKFDVLEGIKANDKEDGDITSSIKIVENTVDTSKVGIYKVVYSVIDSHGETVTKEIKVTVKAKEVETIIGWYKDSKNNWYYYDKNGNKVTGWYNDGYDWYYLNESGIMQSGWNKIDGIYYHMQSSGVMSIGWYHDGYDWYYLNENGAMQKGWKKINGEYYYMQSSGVMSTGWYHDGYDWYYLNENGTMQKGWKEINGEYYHMQESGVMSIGWYHDGYDWYYLNESGVMIKGTATINGVEYSFAENGVML